MEAIQITRASRVFHDVQFGEIHPDPRQAQALVHQRIHGGFHPQFRQVQKDAAAEFRRIVQAQSFEGNHRRRQPPMRAAQLSFHVGDRCEAMPHPHRQERVFENQQ